MIQKLTEAEIEIIKKLRESAFRTNEELKKLQESRKIPDYMWRRRITI